MKRDSLCTGLNVRSTKGGGLIMFADITNKEKCLTTDCKNNTK